MLFVAMCHFVPRNVYRVVSIMLWGLLLAFSVVSVATSKPQPEHFELKLLQLLFVLFLLVLVVVHECRDIICAHSTALHVKCNFVNLAPTCH